MALKLRVKLGGVNNLSDARYAAGMGVEAIGFGIDKEQQGFLDPEAMHAISDWIAGIEIVGETDSNLPEKAAISLPSGVKVSDGLSAE